MPTCTPFVKATSITVGGVALFLFGIIFGAVVHNKIDTGLKDLAGICGGGDDSFENWRTNTGDDAPEKYKYYFGFNATNAREYLEQRPQQAVKLALDMVGPYAMREYDTKYDINFEPDLRSASFRSWERYVFQKPKSCENCDNTDRMVNLNPGFLKLLTATGGEYIAALGFSSLDLAYSAYPPCNQTTIPISMGSDCNPTTNALCCCNRTAPATEAVSCAARASSMWSRFAGFDGGVSFTSPTLAKTVNSFLFINKNLHEAAYGYPSATLGLLGAAQAAAKSDVATLKKMAAYSSLVYAVCSNSPRGIAPHSSEIKGKPYEFLELITCSPIQAALYWFAPTIPASAPVMSQCQAMAQNPKYAAACTCIDPNQGDAGKATAAKPCCTYLGFGCFAKIPGYVSDEMFVTEEQARTNYLEDGTTSNTGCGEYPEGQDHWWTRYESSNIKAIWSQQSRPVYTSPSQPEVIAAAANPQLITYASVVKGGDGTRVAGVGKQSSFLSRQLNNGKPKLDEFAVFITQVQRPATVYYTGTEQYYDVNVARFEPAVNLLSQGAVAPLTNLDNGQVGAGTPKSGIQDVTFITGFPAYVSMPLFLHGDPTALTDGIDVTRHGAAPDVNVESYGTFLLVEPSSGMTVFAHKRLMASFGMYPCSSTSQLCNNSTNLCAGGRCGLTSLTSPFVPAGKVIPQYWMDETAAADDQQMDKIKAIMTLSMAADAVILIFPLLGGVIALFGGYRIYVARRARPAVDHKALLEDTA